MTKAEQVAKRFSVLLNEYLSPGSMAALRRANAEESDPDICHSHDFCDANELMDEAMRGFRKPAVTKFGMQHGTSPRPHRSTRAASVCGASEGRRPDPRGRIAVTMELFQTVDSTASPYWMRVGKFDARAAALADRHYSRRKVGSPQFMPPGETLVLLGCGGRAVFGWWRPHPASGLRAMNGLDGWTCTIFRNESDTLSSRLILEAEACLVARGVECGPDGLITYVWDSRIRSTNPGACFKHAGWRATGRSADGRKTLLQKPWPATSH